jgi:hypothetical protein
VLDALGRGVEAQALCMVKGPLLGVDVLEIGKPREVFLDIVKPTGRSCRAPSLSSSRSS